MSIFKKNRSAALSRPRSGGSSPQDVLRMTPLGGGENEDYRAIRSALPIIDAALQKTVRLCGGFTVHCGHEAVEKELAEFLRTVDAGWGKRGLQSFLDCYLDSMLTYGRAVGEILLRGDREIGAVVCLPPEKVQIRVDDADTQPRFYSAGLGPAKEIAYPELILFTPFQPEVGHPLGVSVLRSMPYLASTLITVYESLRHNYERSGCLRYAVVCKNGNDPLDRINAGERMEQMAEEWSNAMRSGRDGDVRDFVAVGDVDIRTIGADAEIPDTESVVRQLLEQLVSRTGVPPFLLGLSWSSTERMSSQQADIMTSEIWAIRRSLTDVVMQVCELWLALHGYREDIAVEWETVNLQDLEQEAKVRLYDAQTAELEQKIREEAK